MNLKLILLASLASAPIPASTAPVSSQSSVADSSVSQDEMAIYNTVLASWLGKHQGRQLVNEKLSAPPSKHDPEFDECTKGLDFRSVAQGAENKKSLAGIRFKTNGIELIDGSQWKPADPGQGIANGESVETAVRNGFANSLISFSQIAFSRDRKDALVKISMVCGGLCGSGSTIHLHNSATGWGILSRCGEWIS
jgi:hypothetical protein